MNFVCVGNVRQSVHLPICNLTSATEQLYHICVEFFNVSLVTGTRDDAIG